MYGTPYIFHFVHPLVKTAEIMVQRVNFERNLKNIRPATVFKQVKQVLQLTAASRYFWPEVKLKVGGTKTSKIEEKQQKTIKPIN